MGLGRVFFGQLLFSTDMAQLAESGYELDHLVTELVRVCEKRKV